jgi:hypothetical protein
MILRGLVPHMNAHSLENERIWQYMAEKSAMEMYRDLDMYSTPERDGLVCLSLGTFCGVVWCSFVLASIGLSSLVKH